MDAVNVLEGDCSICVLVGSHIKKIIKEKFKSDVIANMALRSICVGKYDPRRYTNSKLDSAYSAVEDAARAICKNSKKSAVMSFESQVANVLKSEWDELTKDSCEKDFVDMAVTLIETNLVSLERGICTS